jgi:hypothetical protein
MTNTWKLFAFGTAAIAVLAAANLEVRSHGRDNVVTKASRAQPASFATSALFGSDSTISTYGLDSQRTIDW